VGPVADVALVVSRQEGPLVDAQVHPFRPGRYYVGNPFVVHRCDISVLVDPPDVSTYTWTSGHLNFMASRMYRTSAFQISGSIRGLPT
jgi:hypothetical protein